MRKIGIALVHGRSMEPTLHEGDRLLVMYGAPPRRGKLAVVLLPDDGLGTKRPLAVKRIWGPDPDGSDGWWVERDNPEEGLDSWAVGAIPAEGMLARVLLRLPAPRLLGMRLRITRRAK